MVGPGLIFYYFIFDVHNIFTKNLKWKIINDFKIVY